jgi:murein DD-endopeptidase MepM/ murein hydrolase activator NlpD
VKTLLFLLIFSVSLFSKVEIHLSHTNVKHGTTFAVVFQNDTNMSQAPNVIFKNKTYQMFTINGSIKKYRVFIPIDYYNKLQHENVQISYRIKDNIIKKNFEITVVDGNYKQNEIIEVSKGKVTLSSENKIRSAKEYNQVYKDVYSKITPYDLTKNSLFQAPMRSKITSDYGNARVYNGKTKSYHSGTDYRAKVGTEIYATNNGIVALVMKRFYLGNVVYIDHGRGAFSYYSHMSDFSVKQGQKVKKGDVIGLSGKTGRITGPHLHYALRLYNVTVDPLQYSSLYNEIVRKYK